MVDYWHANPSLYKENDAIGSKKTSAGKIWEYDRKKSEFIVSKGYSILRYWSSEINDISHETIFEDIVRTSSKVEGESECDSFPRKHKN